MICEIREGSLLCFMIKSVSDPELLIVWTPNFFFGMPWYGEMCINPFVVVLIYVSQCDMNPFVFEVEFDIDIEIMIRTVKDLTKW